MDFGTSISLEIVISLASGIFGAVGAYIKLKSRLDLQEAKNNEQTKELEDIRERKKEMNQALHKRIDDQNSVIQDIQKEMNSGHGRLETEMAKMELRIVEKITDAIKNLNK